MPNTLTTAQLQAAKAMIGTGTTTELNNFYGYMYDQNYGYAALANGVVNCQQGPGTTAQNYMVASAAAQGVTLDAQGINKIEVSMANGYINTLLNYATGTGSTNQDITAQDALDIHSDPSNGVFPQSGLGPQTWTMYTPFQVLDPQTMQAVWAQIISPDPLTNVAGLATLSADMANCALTCTDPAAKASSATWLENTTIDATAPGAISPACPASAFPYLIMQNDSGSGSIGNSSLTLDTINSLNIQLGSDVSLTDLANQLTEAQIPFITTLVASTDDSGIAVAEATQNAIDRQAMYNQWVSDLQGLQTSGANTTADVTMQDASGDNIDVQTAGNASGTVNYQQTTTTAPDGDVSAVITGQGAVATLNNATVNIDAGSSATITGANNNVTAANNSTVALGDNSNWNVVTMMQQGQIIIADADTGTTVYGSDGTITMGTDNDVNLIGNGNTITGGAGDSLTVAGSNIVNLTDGGTVTETAANADLTVNGNDVSSTEIGTPGSYVSATFDASGALIEKDTQTTDAWGDLIEKDTQTTDASGTSDYQEYYVGGALSYTNDVAADGSRTETQYGDSNDPNITQSSQHFDDNGDLVWQSSTQIIDSNGAYLTTTTNPSGQTLSTLEELMDGSTTQTTFNDPSDANLKTVIEDDAQGNLVGVSTTTVGTDSDYLTVRQNGDGETTGTDKTTISFDDQGQQIEHIQSYDANGVLTGSADEVTSIDGHTDTTIDGSGVYADLNNATITLSGKNDSITGFGDVISASNAVLSISNYLGGADDVITGDNNTIASDFSALTLNGAGEVVSGNYDTLNLGADSSATVDNFSYDVITLGAGVNLTADGEGADIYASADDTLVIMSEPGDFNSFYTLNVSDDQNITLGSGTGISVVGSGNAITVEDGLGMTGISDSGGNAIAANNANLSISNGGADDVITGDNNTIVADYSGITLNGTGEIISGQYDTFSLGAGSSDTFNGYSDTITLGEGANLTLSGWGYNTIDASADDTFVFATDPSIDAPDTLNVSDDQNITLESGAWVNVEGSGNSITIDGGSSLQASDDTVNILGTDDQIDGSGDTIAASNSNLTVYSDYGSGADNIITGDNNTIEADYGSFTFNGTDEVLSAYSSTVSLGSDDSASLRGYGDIINLGVGDDLTADGGGDNTINASADDTLDIATDSDFEYFFDNTGNSFADTLNVTDDQNITLESGAAVNIIGSGDFITTEGYNILTISDDTVNVLGTDEWITGSDDNVVASSADLWISDDGADDVITGDDNVVSGDDSSITLDGSDEFSGSSDVVTLIGEQDTTISGGSDDLFYTSADQITLDSDDGSFAFQGGRDDITVSGTDDTVIASSDLIVVSGDDNSVVVDGNYDNFAETGANDSVIDNRADGTSVQYTWDSSGQELVSVFSESGGMGVIIGGVGYTGTGPGSDLPGGGGGGGGGYGYGDGDGDGDGGGYGLAGPQAHKSSGFGANIGSIAQYDLSHGNLSAAAAAVAAQQQAASIAELAPTSGTGSAVLEGAKFDQQVITWSLADSQGTEAAPFSGYMNSTDEAVVQSAFNTWSAAMPGVTFEEVSDSAQSDIRLGFGDFNTSTTGVVGYTSYQANAGQIAPDVIVRVEDSAQDALVTGADEQLVYSGSGASLSQVVLHEIGHALGLADNADQSSVMNYQLTSSNKTLDSTDLAGIGSLYGDRASVLSVGGSGVSMLIQAMSTFNADSGVADTALVPAALSTSIITLAAASHAA